MALYAGLRMPALFGKVLSQSGAFSVPDHDFVVWDLLHGCDPSQIKVWMDAGTMEWLSSCNRSMAALLEERGYAFIYQEFNGGHNYTSWRNDLADGLIHQFGTDAEKTL